MPKTKSSLSVAGQEKHRWMSFSVIMNSGKQHELSVKTSRPAEPDRKPIDMIAGQDAL
jgi:hypothetical protein